MTRLEGPRSPPPVGRDNLHETETNGPQRDPPSGRSPRPTTPDDVSHLMHVGSAGRMVWGPFLDVERLESRG